MVTIKSIHDAPSGKYTVIVANGDFPSHPIPLAYLANADYVVCCDGAANAFLATGRVPDAIVGDCDSISEENSIKYKAILHKNPDQYSNDLTKSVTFCIARNRMQIVLLGATGRREDHALGNISLLTDYMEKVSISMITDFGVFNPISEKTAFESERGQQVSVFSFDNLPVSSSNLKYPLRNFILDRWWKGTLNESLSNNFVIETDGKMVVFRKF